VHDFNELPYKENENNSRPYLYTMEKPKYEMLRYKEKSIST
jgi:hypothetical protein